MGSCRLCRSLPSENRGNQAFQAEGVIKGMEGDCTPLQLLRGRKCSREVERRWSGVRAFNSVVLGTDLLALSSSGTPSQNSSISSPLQISDLDVSAPNWLNH